MSWDAELIHSPMPGGTNGEMMSITREKRMLRAKRNPPDHFPQWISMHGRSREHEDWQQACVENIWEYLVSHLDFPFFGMSRMSRCPRSLADTLTQTDAKMAQNTCNIETRRLPVDLELLWGQIFLFDASYSYCCLFAYISYLLG